MTTVSIRELLASLKEVTSNLVNLDSRDSIKVAASKAKSKANTRVQLRTTVSNATNQAIGQPSVGLMHYPLLKEFATIAPDFMLKFAFFIRKKLSRAITMFRAARVVLDLRTLISPHH